MLQAFALSVHALSLLLHRSLEVTCLRDWTVHGLETRAGLCSHQRDIDHSRRCTSLPQDVLTLTRAPATRRALRQMLQQLFRAKRTLKVGFGLEGDLGAIAAALGHEGGGCVARVASYIDVRQLHTHLRHTGAPVTSASGIGLSGAHPWSL
jgi:hypothetical protein